METFTGSLGDELVGRLDLPVEPPRAFALFAHCSTCGKDIAAASAISSGLVAEGYGILRFDFTGLAVASSPPTPSHPTWATWSLPADMLREGSQAPALLVGHSLGGAAVLAAAGEIPEVVAVATVAAPSQSRARRCPHPPPDALRRIEENGDAEVDLGGRPFRVRRQLLNDLGSQRLSSAVERLGAALLILHSPVDTIVELDHARHIYEAARHPKSFVSLDGADHLLTDRADAAFMARMIAAWSARYLPATNAELERGGLTAGGSGDRRRTGGGSSPSGSGPAATPSRQTRPSGSTRHRSDAL